MEINKAIIFDRDGVVNELVNVDGSLRPPWNINELEINYSLLKITEKLKQNNFKLFVVSNQPDVKRGNLKFENLEKINTKLDQIFNFDEILFDVTDDIRFKKPSPYMINKLVVKYNLERKNTWLIGDRWVDILAAKNAGINSILLEREYSLNQTSIGKMPKDLIFEKKITNLIELKNLFL